MKRMMRFRAFVILTVLMCGGCSDMLFEFAPRDLVYVLSSNGVYFSIDDGTTWKRIRDNHDLIADNTGRLFVRNGSVYVAGGNLAASGISILHKNSTTWKTTTTNDMPFPFNPTGLYVDDRGMIFVSSQGGGLYKSGDGGSSFTQIYNNRIACVFVNAGTVYAGGRDSGDNHATVWRLDYDGNQQGAALDLGCNGLVNDIEVEGGMIYAAVEDDAGNGCLYTSAADTIVWQQVYTRDGPFLDVLVQDEKIYIAAYNAFDAGLILSSDSGVNFITLSPEDTLESNACTRVAVNCEKTTMYVVSDAKLCVSYNDIHKWRTKTELDGPAGSVYDVFTVQ
jgi:hypothetical protein